MRYIVLYLFVLVFSSCYCQSNLIKVKKDGKWGFINKNGQVKVPYQFNNVGNFNSGLIRVQKGDKWGYLDLEGKVVIPFSYTEAYDFSEGYATVLNKDSIFVININNKKIYSGISKSTFIETFNEGFAVVKNNEKFNYLSTTGKFLCKNYFDDAFDFNDGVGVVVLGENYGVIDSIGNYIIYPKYNYISEFSNGIAAVRLDSLSFYINKKDNNVFNQNFDFTGSFINERAIVGKRTKSGEEVYGVIDTSGKIIITPQFTFLSPFITEYAVFCSGNNCGFIDKEGNKILSGLNFPSKMVKGYAIIKEGGMQYMIDKTSERILGPYNSIFIEETIDYGLVMVFNEGSWTNLVFKNGDAKYAIVDLKGKLVWSNW